VNEDTSNNIITSQSLDKVGAVQQNFDKKDKVAAADVSEATHESRSFKEPASHSSAQMADEEVQQKAPSGEPGKKKIKKKKPRMATNEMQQWRNPHEFAPENYMMPMGPPPPPYNPFWNGGMPGGMDPGYMGGPYPGPMPPYMGFGFGPMDVPFPGVMPTDPFAPQGYMMPPFMPPQRDPAEYGMGMNGGPPLMSREEFESHKAGLKRKREMEQRRGRREFPNDQEFNREMSSTGDGKLKSSKSNIAPPQRSGTEPQQRHRSSPERHHESSKRKSHYYEDEEPDYHRDRHSHHRSERSRSTVEAPPSKSSAAAAAAAAAEAERKLKTSVFSRISFPEREEASKKRKLVSEPAPPREEQHKASSRKSVEYESSDEERHFKRRPSTYESSPVAEDGAGGRHSRGSRDRGREERDRSKHR
jgi:E3 ubiquitin-protein ligase RBBP6